MDKVRYQPGDRVLDLVSETVVTIEHVLSNGYVIRWTGNDQKGVPTMSFAQFSEVTEILQPRPERPEVLLTHTDSNRDYLEVRVVELTDGTSTHKVVVGDNEGSFMSAYLPTDAADLLELSRVIRNLSDDAVDEIEGGQAICERAEKLYELFRGASDSGFLKSWDKLSETTRDRWLAVAEFTQPLSQVDGSGRLTAAQVTMIINLIDNFGAARQLMGEARKKSQERRDWVERSVKHREQICKMLTEF